MRAINISLEKILIPIVVIYNYDDIFRIWLTVTPEHTAALLWIHLEKEMPTLTLNSQVKLFMFGKHQRLFLGFSSPTFIEKPQISSRDDGRVMIMEFKVFIYHLLS